MTLIKLLKWAKKYGLYIEIKSDGSAQVQVPCVDGEYVDLAEGNNLYAALRKAKRELNKIISMQSAESVD